MPTNKVALYSKCEQCRKLASAVDLEMVELLSDILRTERMRLHYEKSRLMTDNVESNEAIVAKCQRFTERLDLLMEADSRLRIHKDILERKER